MQHPEQLARLDDPEAELAEACRLLGEQLGADRVVAIEIVNETWAIQAHAYLAGTASAMSGAYPVGEFALEMRRLFAAAGTLVIDDIAAAVDLPAAMRAAWLTTGCAATISIGFVRNDRWVASLGIHAGTPRHWQPIDIALAELTADRVWMILAAGRHQTATRADAGSAVAAASADARGIVAATAVQAISRFARVAAEDAPTVDVLADLAAAARDALGATAADIAVPAGNELTSVAGVVESGVHRPSASANIADGPHVEAWRSGQVVVVRDPASHLDRWPTWAHFARTYGIAAALAMPLHSGGDVIGVISVADRQPRAWTDAELATLDLLASMASAAIAQSARLERAETEATQLRHALASRVVIEQATGMLAAEGGLDVADAFDLLRSHARRNRVPLRAVADAVVHGARPGDLRVRPD